MNKKCYFWEDTSIPEDIRCFTVICETCHTTHPQGWAWEDGFGKWDVTCDICKTLIHKGINETPTNI